MRHLTANAQGNQALGVTMGPHIDIADLALTAGEGPGGWFRPRPVLRVTTNLSALL